MKGLARLEVSIENRDENQEWLEGSEWTIEVGWGESRVLIGGQSKSLRFSSLAKEPRLGEL